VPYSDFLSSAETAGGQRRIRARKRKKEKDNAETRRVVCVLVGRDMLREEKMEDKHRSFHTLFYIYFSRERPRILFGHVTPLVTISHDFDVSLP
jgi:hypothetical protein